MSSKNVANTIIANSVNSTKKWLYRYLLDNVNELDKNYQMIEQCVKDIYIFQNAILEQVEKKEEKVIIGDETLNSIFKDEKNLNSYDLSLIYDSVLYFRESATILRDEEKVSIEKILKIIRGA